VDWIQYFNSEEILKVMFAEVCGKITY
jgi:hypothetical protein